MDDKKKLYTEEDIKHAIDYGIFLEAGLVQVDYGKYEDKYQQFLSGINENN